MSNLSLESHKKLVEESKNKKFLIEDLQDEFSSLGPESVGRHHKLQLQYWELKHTLRGEQLRLYLFEAYDSGFPGDKDNAACPTSISDKELRGVVETLREFKGRLEDSKNRIEELADRMEIAIKQFREDTGLMEKMISDLEQKKQKMSETYGDMSDMCNQASVLQEPEDNLKPLQKKIQDTIHNISEKISELRRQIETSQTAADKYTNELQIVRGTWRIMEWCDQYCKMLQQPVGLIDRGLSRDGWTVDICGPHGSHTEPLLRVVINLFFDGFSKPKINYVKVNNNDFDTSAVVDRAVAINNVQYLLTNLQEQWLREYLLLKEIYHLRQKFAIDWEFETRRMSIVCDKAAVVCVLKVDDGYPNHGGVILEAVKGNENWESSTPKPCTDRPTLTEWVECLSEGPSHASSQ